MSLLTDAATEAVYPILPVFLTRVLGAPPAALGLIEGAADATSSILKVLAGRWSDRLAHRKPLVLAGYALSSVARPFMALTAAWPHVLAVRLTDRVGKGLRGAPRDAILAAAAPPGERGRVFGYHWGMDHAGAAVGPLLAAAFLWIYPEEYRWLFALTLIPGLAAVLTLTLVKEPERETTEEGRPKTEDAGPPSSFRLPASLKRYFLVVSVFTLGNSSDSFLLLRFADAGAPADALPLLWSAQHALKASLSVFGGRLSDRFGRRTLMTAGWTIYAAAYAGFAFTTSIAWLIFWFMVYGTYAACVEGTEKALVADLTPAESRGTAFGWLSAVQGVGVLAASVAFGLIYQSFGSQAAFLTGAGLAMTAALGLRCVPGMR